MKFEFLINLFFEKYENFFNNLKLYIKLDFIPQRYNNLILKNNEIFNYTDKSWLIYSNLISLFLIIIFIILIGIIFLNKAIHVKILNLISAFYLTIYFWLISLNYNYDFFNLNLTFNQNTSLFINLFILIATITVLIFFLGISDIFFIEENMKIEFSFLIWFIYIASIFLISSTDFISIIILLECIAFSSYILVGFNRKNKFSTTSAIKYLILGSIPGGVFILGLSLLYNNYGSFSQDYLLILLQSLLTPNWFNLTTIDFYLEEILPTLFSLYEKQLNYNWLSSAYTQGSNKEFQNYLSTLDWFFGYYTPFLPIQMISLEKFNIIIQTRINIESTVKFNFFIKNCYILYLDAYLLVIDELYFFKETWELYWSSNYKNTRLDFAQPETFAYLFQKEYFNILSWFSALSLTLYFEEIFFFNTYAYRVTRGVFSVNEFQIANLKSITMYQIFENKWSFHHTIITGFENFEDNINLKIIDEINEILKTIASEFHEDATFWRFIRNLDEICIVNSFVTAEPYPYIFNNYYLENLNCYFFYDLIQQTTIYYLNHTSLILYLILIFIITNISFKLTAAPFHFWAPSVYGGAPLATVTFLSIFSKLTLFFMVIWLFLNTFDSLKDIWQILFFIIALLSVIFSILGAFSEKIFKRFFVYSSTGHVGFLIIGISVLNIEGLKGTLDYLLIYILSSFLIWFIIMHLSKKTTSLVNLKGLSFNQTYLSLIFSIVIFSLSGIPPMAGFFVKYEIFSSLINSSLFFLAYILLILTVISFFYYLRLIKIIFFENQNIFVKNKNLNDLKLRVIAFIFLFIPLFMIFIDNNFNYILKEILIIALI